MKGYRSDDLQSKSREEKGHAKSEIRKRERETNEQGKENAI
jgi:hypothetical protein